MTQAVDGSLWPQDRIGRDGLAAPGSRLSVTAPGVLECVFVIVALSLFLSVPFLVGDQPQGEDSLNPVKQLESLSTQGDAVKQLVFAGIYFCAVVLIALRTQVRSLLTIGVPLLLLTVWCFASAGWAGDPNVSLRRSVAMLGTVLLALYLGVRFDVRQFLRLMRYVIAIVLVGSLVVAAVWPAAGLDYEGRLRGVFSHKNALSGFATIALIMLTALLLDRHYRSRIGVALDACLAVIAIGAMLLAHSSGAVPVLAVGIPMLFLMRLVRRADGAILAALPVMVCVATAAAGMAVHYSDSIAELLGRDADISGRTLIWKFAATMFFDHLWTGYGYGTFWEGFSSPGGAFWSVSHLGAPHSHDGYLQLALDAGAIGLGLFLAALLVLVFRMAWLVRRGSEPLVGWTASFLGLFLATNLVETRLWVGNQIDTLLFVYIVVYVNLSLSRAVAAYGMRRMPAPVGPATLQRRTFP
jgi:O-antigen ligase